MGEDLILDINAFEKDITDESFSKTQHKREKSLFKEKICPVIAYSKRQNTLDVNFDGYGIRIKNVKSFSGETAIIKYKSEIGKPDFEYKL